jgi:formiminotetrahydrofolate cyclodeaminase
VLININAIKDQDFAGKARDELNALLAGKPALKDQIYDLVVEKL